MDEERLAALWLEGRSTREIATALHVTLDQVRGKARRMGLPKRYLYKNGERKPGKPPQVYRKPSQIFRQPDNPDRKQRTCLCCRAEFLSEHCGNRICDSCKGSEAFHVPLGAHVSRPPARHGGAP